MFSWAKVWKCDPDGRHAAAGPRLAPHLAAQALSGRAAGRPARSARECAFSPASARARARLSHRTLTPGRAAQEWRVPG